MIDYEKLNSPIINDEPIKVLFQRKVNGEYQTYLSVGEYIYTDMIKALKILLEWKDKA